MPLNFIAARLICTAPEFDALARQVGLKSHKDGVTDPAKRAKIRAELDAQIAHLYGLTEPNSPTFFPPSRWCRGKPKTPRWRRLRNPEPQELLFVCILLG